MPNVVWLAYLAGVARTRILSFPLFLFSSANAAAQDKADEFITAQMQRQNIPGMSIAIVRNGLAELYLPDR